MSNAYDADATRVDIIVDDNLENVVVLCESIGMTSDEFRDAYASIARFRGSSARSVTGLTQEGLFARAMGI